MIAIIIIIIIIIILPLRMCGDPGIALKSAEIIIIKKDTLRDQSTANVQLVEIEAEKRILVTERLRFALQLRTSGLIHDNDSIQDDSQANKACIPRGQ